MFRCRHAPIGNFRSPGTCFKRFSLYGFNFLFSFSIGSVSQQRNQQVISDSGTSWITGPSASIRQIVGAINAQYDNENEIVRTTI
jgi:hypothetical protein